MKLLKVKTSSRMYSTFTHHSLVTIILSKIMMASLNKSQMKWDLFRQYRRKKVTSLSKALCQLYFQFKKTLSSRQNCPLGEKKKLFQLFELIFPVHLIHSYIHSGDSSGQLREGLYCHWQQ